MISLGVSLLSIPSFVKIQGMRKPKQLSAVQFFAEPICSKVSIGVK
jgi:hypothetical protein